MRVGYRKIVLPGPPHRSQLLGRAGGKNLSELPGTFSNQPIAPALILAQKPNSLSLRSASEIAELITLNVRSPAQPSEHAGSLMGQEAAILEKALAFYFAATNLKPAYACGDVIVKDLHGLMALRAFENNPQSLHILAISLAVEKDPLEQKIISMMETIKINLGQAKPWDLEKSSAVCEPIIAVEPFEKMYPFSVQTPWYGLGIVGCLVTEVVCVFAAPFGVSGALPTSLLSLLALFGLVIHSNRSKKPWSIAKRLHQMVGNLQKEKQSMVDAIAVHQKKWAVDYRANILAKAGHAEQASDSVVKEIVQIVSSGDKSLLTAGNEKRLKADADRAGLALRQVRGITAGIISA